LLIADNMWNLSLNDFARFVWWSNISITCYVIKQGYGDKLHFDVSYLPRFLLLYLCLSSKREVKIPDYIRTLCLYQSHKPA